MSEIPTRPFGKTGEKVSILGLGGGHLGRPTISETDAVRIVQRAIDGGVTFMDNAWEYRKGHSEGLMGRAIHDRREPLFVMTKVCARDRETAEKQLHDSLRRLRTDYVDLWQFHEINYANDHEWIFRAGGAAEAGEAAVKAGKVRYLGFTGHKDPTYLLSMLQHDYPWSSVQLPVNFLDATYRSFTSRVLPELKKRGIAAIGMKSLGGDGQLVTKVKVPVEDCLRYALSQDIVTLVAGMDSIDVVDQNVRIARSFQTMPKEEQEALIARTREVAGDGRYEWFKSTDYYDSPYHREQHGFPVPLIREL